MRGWGTCYSHIKKVVCTKGLRQVVELMKTEKLLERQGGRGDDSPALAVANVMKACLKVSSHYARDV